MVVRMRLGTNAVFSHEAPEQLAEIFHKKGLRAAAFPVDCNASEKLIHAYEKAFADYDIMIAEVGVWNSPFSSDEGQAERSREFCRRQLELADEVKARCCVNVSGSAGEIWSGCYAENYSEELYKRNIEFVRWLLDTVKPRNTFYTLEPMQWMLPDSPQSYLKFMEDVNRSRLAVHFDPVNFVNSPKKAMLYGEYLDEAIGLLAPHIKSCHLKDFDIIRGLTVQIVETLPGTGRAELRSYIEKINAIDDEMPMLVEHLGSEDEYDRAFEFIGGIMRH